MHAIATMTPRERFLETMTFGSPDRVPLRPGGPRESTLRAWRRQGLPEGVHYHDALLKTLGIDQRRFGGSGRPPLRPGVSFKMIPVFEEKVLEHKNGHYIIRDWMGAITEISDAYDYTYIRNAKDFVTRKWHKFPVETRADWEKMKPRYKVDAPGRFPDDFKERCARMKERDYVVRVSVNGPFWQLREWCGFENLCILMAEEPEFVEEMAAFWTEFISRTLGRILECAPPDEVMISEDMAYKVHSMISPAMARRFLMPAWRRWTRESKAAGCPLVSMDSDGDVRSLMPLWIEAGINTVSPMEAAAGNDLPEYRRRYGKRMAYHGGLDKRVLAVGGEAMRKEVLRVVPPLFEQGGFIPGCDHGVPPDISWPHYVAYARLLAELSAWL